MDTFPGRAKQAQILVVKKVSREGTSSEAFSGTNSLLFARNLLQQWCNLKKKTRTGNQQEPEANNILEWKCFSQEKLKRKSNYAHVAQFLAPGVEESVLSSSTLIPSRYFWLVTDWPSFPPWHVLLVGDRLMMSTSVLLWTHPLGASSARRKTWIAFIYFAIFLIFL